MTHLEVIHLNDRFVTGGVATIIRLLHTQLSLNDISSETIVNDTSNSIIPAKKLKKLGFGLDGLQKLATFISSILPFSLFRLILTNKIHKKKIVLHLHCPYPSIAISSLIASFLTNTPLIYSVHANKSHLPKVYWRLEKLLIYLSHKVVFELRASYNDYPSSETENKFQYIPFGVEKNSARLKWIKPKDNLFTFIIANRLDKNRMTDVLIQSFYEYKKTKNANLIIIGEGPERQNLVSLISSLGLNRYVLFKSPKKEEDLQFYFSKCNCLLTISASGEVGMTGKIAAGIGMPLLTYEFDSDSTESYQATTPSELAKKMSLIEELDDESLYSFTKTISAKLESYADEMFSAHIKLYKEIV